MRVREERVHSVPHHKSPASQYYEFVLCCAHLRPLLKPGGPLFASQLLCVQLPMVMVVLAGCRQVCDFYFCATVVLFIGCPDGGAPEPQTSGCPSRLLPSMSVWAVLCRQKGIFKVCLLREMLVQGVCVKNIWKCTCSVHSLLKPCPLPGYLAL